LPIKAPKCSFCGTTGVGLLTCCAACRTCRAEITGRRATLRDGVRRDAARTRRGAARERCRVRTRETRLTVFLDRTRRAFFFTRFTIGKGKVNCYLNVSAEKKKMKKVILKDLQNLFKQLYHKNKMINFDDMVDRFLESEIRIRTIGRYYPSEVGQCMRKTWYAFRNPKPADKEIKKVFEAGNRLHEFVADVFQSDKVEEVELVEKEVPFELNIDDFTISGRIDDLIRIKLGSKEALVEVKSTKDLRYMEEPSESHVMQLQLYLHARKMKEGIILYLEKNTLKSRSFHIFYDINVFNQVIDRFRELHKRLMNGQLPSPESRLDDDKRWMCRSCQYAEECFKDTPDINLGDFVKE